MIVCDKCGAWCMPDNMVGTRCRAAFGCDGWMVNATVVPETLHGDAMAIMRCIGQLPDGYGMWSGRYGGFGTASRATELRTDGNRRT